MLGISARLVFKGAGFMAASGKVSLGMEIRILELHEMVFIFSWIPFADVSFHRAGIKARLSSTLSRKIYNPSEWT